VHVVQAGKAKFVREPECRELKLTCGVTQQQKAQIHPSQSRCLSGGPHLSGFLKDVSHTVSTSTVKTLDSFSFGPQRVQYHVFSLLDHPLIAFREILVNVEEERWLSQTKLRIIIKKKSRRGGTPRIHSPTHHPVIHSVTGALPTFNSTIRML